MDRFNILKGVAPISLNVEPVPVIEMDEGKKRKREIEAEGELTIPVHTIPASVGWPGPTLIQSPNYYCPQCGTHSQNSVNIHFDNDNNNLNGQYCMNCLAQWISWNVPRLISE